MSDRPLRILWITTSATWDGPGRALGALLRSWSAPDSVVICVLKHADADFCAAMPAGVRVVSLGMGSVFDAAVVWRVVSLCREYRPDVVHTQLSRADWVGRLVARSLSLPVVTTIQNVHSRMYASEFSWTTSRLAIALDWVTSKVVTRFIAVSPGVKVDLVEHGVPGERVSVIANPFDTKRKADATHRDQARAAWGVRDSDVVVGTVALLKEQKGVRDLIAAARLVADAHPGVRFVHLGGGPLDREARRWIADAGLSDRFVLMGWVDDPLAYLPGMDVFVLPSLWEGLPIALLEAMAVGLPAVGTRVAGIEDVIVDGATGRLVPPQDPTSLASALLALIGAPHDRARMGQAGRNRVALYAAGPIAESVRAVYLEVLGVPGVAER